MGANCLGGPSKVVTNNNLLSNKDTNCKDTNLRRLDSSQKFTKQSNGKEKNSKEYCHLNETNESEELANFKLERASNEKLMDITILENALKKQFFMRAFDHNMLVEIIKIIPLYSIKSGGSIYEYNSFGNYFFIIQKGQVSLQLYQLNEHGQPKKVNEKILNPGDSFGELALMQELRRTQSASALRDSLIYCLERKEFRRIINKINQDNFEENKGFVQSVAVLSIYNLI